MILLMTTFGSWIGCAVLTSWMMMMMMTVTTTTAASTTASQEEPKDEALSSTVETVHSHPQPTRRLDESTTKSSSSSLSSHVRVAFLGNSIQYYNDCPRLLQQMIDSSSSSSLITTTTNHSSFCIQNSCLRGGASLPSLFEKGNGMQQRFRTPQAIRKRQSSSSSSWNTDDVEYDIGASTVVELLETQPSWDFIILNDHTQAPAREASAQRTREYLQQYYAPYFIQQNKNHPHNRNQANTTTTTQYSRRGTKILFLQTPAYRVPGIKESDDLGDFDTMTDAVAAGVSSYVHCLRQVNVPHVRMAPVGQAYRIIQRQHPHLFPKLYALDDFHPSPYGTWLQACVLYCIMFQTSPPTYNTSWWKQSRYMMPIGDMDDPASFIPTAAEALELAKVACTLVGVQPEESQG